MGELIRDLRYAIRLLLKRPAFAAVAVLSLGLGIGANTVIFSLVNELFLNPIPIENGSRVAAIFTQDERNPGFSQLSHLNWKDLREQSRTFDDVAGYTLSQVAVSTGSDEPQIAFGQLVSGNYFDTLGVRAVLGRTFLPSEDGAPGNSAVVVLGHRFFTDNLAGDESIVDREITINGQSFTVIGVAPPAFEGLNVGIVPALWVPFSMNRLLQPDPELNWFEERRGLFLFGFGRLADGVTIEEARSELALIGGRLAAEYPDENEGRSFSTLPIAEASIVPQARGGVVAGTGMLMATVALVLLIACVNVANLLLARATERRSEIALRLALGVRRSRLIRQLLTESVVVALLGGLFGIGVAVISKSLILGSLPNLGFGAALTIDLALDPRVMLFALLLTLLTGLLFGLIPAVQSSRPELVGSLKDSGDLSGTGPLTVRNVLVVGQLALSLVALLGSGLFLRSLWAAQEIDLGFPADRLIAVTFDVGMAGYDQPRGEQFYRDAVERVASLPGIEQAAVAQAAPLQGVISRSIVLPDADSEQERTFVQVNVVDPGYFETMELPIVRGRAFSELDRAGGRRVVVINETMASRFWPDREAVGQRFSFFNMEPSEVIGVAKDIKYNTPGENPQPYAYQPLAQQYSTTVALIARSSGDPSLSVVAAEREIRAMDPGLPMVNVGTVEDLVGNALFAPRFAAVFLGVLGLLALVLAAIGIYGVMSFAVARRVREIGVRMALGANRGAVLGLVMRQGLVLTVAGLGAGLVLALLVTRLLQNLLFVSPTDMPTFVATSAVLMSVSTAAVLVTAVRAMRVDPMRVLRGD